MQVNQYVVDRSIGVEHAHPGIDPQQERGPEGQDDEQQQDVAPRPRGARDAVGHGIAQQQAEQGGKRGNLHRIHIAVPIQRIVDQKPVIVVDVVHDPLPAAGPVEGRNGGCLAGQRDRQHDAEGGKEEEQQPGIGRRDDQLAPAAAIEPVLEACCTRRAGGACVRRPFRRCCHGLIPRAGWQRWPPR